MPQERPHIALFSECGFGNFGNDGTLEVVLNHLRGQFPHARVTCVVRNAETVAAQFQTEALSFYPAPFFPAKTEWALARALRRAANEAVRLYNAFKFLLSVDCMVIPGGGRFDDFNSAATEQPYRLWVWTKLARLAGARVEMLAIGAGPVDFALSKWFYRGVARAVNRRSFRDAESRDFVAQQLGADTHGDELTGDLVFACRTRANAPAPRTPVRTIGVGVMEYNNRRGAKGGPDDEYDAYLANLTTICLGLLKRDLDVKILIGETCDRSAANDLHARLAAQAPEKRAAFEICLASSLHDVLAHIARCDAVIATRFHNIVAALRLGRPTLSLSYATKNERLMEEFGLGAYCQTIETCDPARLLDQFDDLRANAARLAPRIRARASALRRQMEDCLDELSQRIRAEAPVTADAEPSAMAQPLRRSRAH